MILYKIGEIHYELKKKKTKKVIRKRTGIKHNQLISNYPITSRDFFLTFKSQKILTTIYDDQIWKQFLKRTVWVVLRFGQ